MLEQERADGRNQECMAAVGKDNRNLCGQMSINQKTSSYFPYYYLPMAWNDIRSWNFDPTQGSGGKTFERLTPWKWNKILYWSGACLPSDSYSKPSPYSPLCCRLAGCFPGSYGSWCLGLANWKALTGHWRAGGEETLWYIFPAIDNFHGSGCLSSV